MEFGWAEEQASFRLQLQNFLERALPAEWDEIAGHGPENVPMFKDHWRKQVKEETKSGKAETLFPM